MKKIGEMRTHVARISFLFFCAFLLSAQQLRAENVSFSAEVNTNQVSLGLSLQLTLNIEGVTNIGEINLPPIDGFAVNYLGPSTHVSVVNGKYYSSKSFTYSLLPQRTGRFVIQPLNITIDGKNYTTQPIEIEVIDTQVPANDALAQAQRSLQDKISLVMRVPKKDLYMNEALPVKIMMLVNGLAVRDIRYPQINNIGLLVDNFGQPKQYQQVINGLRYDIVEFDTVIYPTRSGALTLGPAQMECNLIIKDDQRRSMGGLFDDDFFNSFFDRNQKQAITLTSDTITLNVLELPEEGKPKDFSGAVGNYDFEVSASPGEVKVGDPVTLRMNIKGRGNLKAVEFPQIESENGFKIYKPSIKEDAGGKSLEQVILPLNDQVKEVPLLEFSFFDPQLKKYRNLTQGPLPLSVKPLEKGESPDIIGYEPQEAEPRPKDVLGKDIVFIKDRIGALHKAGGIFSGNPFYYAVLMMLIFIWSGGYLRYKWTHRLATDKIFARKLKAPKEARQGLQTAQDLLKQGDQAGFYDTLFKALQQYCAHKFHIAKGAVTAQSVHERIEGQTDEKLIKELDSLFKECESVRYASALISKEAMQQSYQMAVRIIDQLERHFK